MFIHFILTSSRWKNMIKWWTILYKYELYWNKLCLHYSDHLIKRECLTKVFKKYAYLFQLQLIRNMHLFCKCTWLYNKVQYKYCRVTSSSLSVEADSSSVWCNEAKINPTFDWRQSFTYFHLYTKSLDR